MFENWVFECTTYSKLYFDGNFQLLVRLVSRPTAKLAHCRHVPPINQAGRWLFHQLNFYQFLCTQPVIFNLTVRSIIILIQ